MAKAAKAKPKKKQRNNAHDADDSVFVVARRLGADESKARFEAQLKKITKAPTKR